MNEKESEHNQNKLLEEWIRNQILQQLPQQYFDLMNDGSKLAKEGQFSKAAEKFASARKEVAGILRSLMEMKKDHREQEWQFFGILWAFKLIKSVFYWLLAQSETAESLEERKGYLLAAMGAQLVGTDMIPAFETLNQSFTGADLELLPLLGEAIRNHEHRQNLLEKALEANGIEFKF
ncbi:MAG: hypothetical protein ACFE89_11260 [Candidatus Hodarchaeota archaeon]